MPRNSSLAAEGLQGLIAAQHYTQEELGEVMAIMKRTVSKIGTLDTSAWTADDKSNFRDTLVRMRTDIEAFLNAPPA